MKEETIRTAMVLGEEAISVLNRKHVAVFGVGGVGSFAAEALARAGVGELTLVDDDVVSVSNINRQLIALHSTVGMPKTEVMAKRIADINPECTVHVISERFTEETRETFFSNQFDYIADCIDSVKCKACLIETAISREIPILSAMGTGNKLDPSQFIITDLSKTKACPLARSMRYELKQRGIRHHTVLYSEELPTRQKFQPDAHTIVPGSVSWVPGCAGLMIAGYIIQHLI